MHLDETGVGALLEDTVRACRRASTRMNCSLKLGVVGNLLCSDYM